MNQTAVMLSRARRGRGGAISYQTIQCNKEVDHHFILGWRPTGFFKNNEHQRCLKVVKTWEASCSVWIQRRRQTCLHLWADPSWQHLKSAWIKISKKMLLLFFSTETIRKIYEQTKPTTIKSLLYLKMFKNYCCHPHFSLSPNYLV